MRPYRPIHYTISTKQHITIPYSTISVLPQLDESVETLNCSCNYLTSLPHLPHGLKYLNCSSNKIRRLPKLPSTLRTLVCDENELTELPELPEGLDVLSCINNKITHLPLLPASLKTINISFNPVVCLPPLPIGIITLICSYTHITGINHIPSSTIVATMHSSKIQVVPEIIGLEGGWVVRFENTPLIFAYDGDNNSEYMANRKAYIRISNQCWNAWRTEDTVASLSYSDL